MELTEEEKKVFEVEKYGCFDPFIIGDMMLPMYDTDLNDERIHEFNVTLNFVKKMINESSKRKNYKIDDNEKYDIDTLLAKIIEAPEKGELLSDFNPLLYKSPNDLEEYFKRITINSG